MPKLNADILTTNHPSFESAFVAMPTFSEDDFKKNIVRPHYRLLSMLLKIYAYKYQLVENGIAKYLLPANWQIEHIFPQKWDSHYFDISETEQELIEHIGNKIPFEQKLNIQAGNGFFSTKKEKYQESNIQVVKMLLSYSDWTPQNIEARDKQVTDEIWDTLNTWNREYQDATTPQCETQTLTKEQAELLEKLKATGYKFAE